MIIIIKVIILPYDLGKCLIKLFRYEDAIQMYNKAIQLYPSYYYYNDLGNLLDKFKRYEEAIDVFDKAI